MNNNQQQQQHHMPMEPGSSLTRYRSAPSSYFATLLSSPAGGDALGEDDFERLFDPRASSPEAQRVFARFTDGTETVRRNSPTANMPSHSQFLPPQPQPRKVEPQQQLQENHTDDYSSYGGFMGPYNAGQVKMERVAAAAGGNSGLIRHSSSPAGLFADIDIENEFGAMRDMGSFGGVNNSANGETSTSSASRFKRQMNPIPELDIKDRGENNASNAQFDENRGNDVDYITGLPMNSWDDSEVVMSDNFFKGLDEQSNDGGSQPSSRLSHHLSLPTSSSELSAMEKLLQDSVPCKIRAKRGFATHPRSIAERVRRTKISERIRKLQELVPNMDKQTNTSDMLDLAVDYIKDLERQVKTLSDNRAKCSCSSVHNS